MYVKRHTVHKGGRDYVYLRLVEAYRNQAGQVRHRLLRTLGREDQLKASGQLDQLAASFARLDPPRAGTRRLVGPLLLVACYLRRLGRALEALAPVAEEARGRLALAAAARCGVDMSRLHLDLTAVRFTGAYEDSSLVAKGWAADRTIGRQVKTLQASTPPGVAVYYRPHNGAANELPCFAAALERLATLAPPSVVVVTDSGMGYLGTLAAADAKRLRFVAPLRADTGWAGRFTTDVGTLDALAGLDYRPQREARLPPGQRTRWRGILRPFPIDDPGTGRHDLRVAYIWSSEEAASVRGGKPSLSWSPNQAAITAASRLDGLYALATNLPDPRPGQLLTALDILKLYKDQWVVEQRHRGLQLDRLTPAQRMILALLGIPLPWPEKPD